MTVLSAHGSETGTIDGMLDRNRRAGVWHIPRIRSSHKSLGNDCPASLTPPFATRETKHGFVLIHEPMSRFAHAGTALGALPESIANRIGRVVAVFVVVAAGCEHRGDANEQLMPAASQASQTSQASQASQASQDGSSSREAWDLYDWGIHVAKVDVVTESGATNYQIRERNREKATWSLPLTIAITPNDDFGDAPLPSSVSKLLLLRQQAETQTWDDHTSVTMPGPKQDPWIYEPGPSSELSIGGRSVEVRPWRVPDAGILRDGTPPVDVLISGGTVVGLIVPSEDRVFVQRGFETVTTVVKWSEDGVSEPRWGYRALPRQMVAMPDGVRLATYVWLPSSTSRDADDNARFPVILTRSPYGAKDVIDRAWHHVARGYAFVAQDVRGRGASEGTWEFVRHEADDGHATLDWIAAQRWCDGNIGMQGGSYRGGTQWMAARRGHPALRALVPVNSMGPAFADIPYTAGGGFQAAQLAWIFLVAGVPMERDDWGQVHAHRPIVDIDRFGLGRESELWNLWLAHPVRDAFWRHIDWRDDMANVQIPTLHISGWYDDNGRGTLANLEPVRDKPHQRIMFGAWRHGLNGDRAINGVAFGPDSIRPDLQLVMQKWYDRFLRGVENGIERVKAEYYVTGDNVWKQAEQWPPSDAVLERWYLHGSGHAATSMTDGTLSSIAPETEPPDRYSYDPRDPTPSLLDVSLNEFNLPKDFAEVEQRPDVASYTSLPLESELEIAGKVDAVLFAASSARDTDWFVHLADVDESGKSIRLLEAMVRARFRESTDVPRLLTPGKVERYTLDLRAHAHVFKKGHRVRFAVASASAGYVFPNSNTGGDETTTTTSKVAHQQIFHSATQPSHVVLPVVRRNAPAKR